MNDPCIDIVMACFNGEKFVSEQIESILNQTYSNWHLTIRDDGSTDNTIAIIEEYRQQNPQKISVVTDQAGNVGSIINFSLLLQQVRDADYIMFCDQDDVWLPDKIAHTFSVMKEKEQEYGKQCPILVYTNFQYVDEGMRIIESKKDFHINTISNLGFSQLLAQNPVYGCTSIINQALANIVESVPSQAENHDHWIALVASAFGILHYLDERTILYRQHGKNISGSHDNDSLDKRMKRIFLQKKNYTDIVARRNMICAFNERYTNTLAPVIKNILDVFLRSFKRKNLLLKDFKNGVRCQTTPQTFLFYTTLLFSKFDDAPLCESKVSHPFIKTDF